MRRFSRVPSVSVYLAKTQPHLSLFTWRSCPITAALEGSLEEVTTRLCYYRRFLEALGTSLGILIVLEGVIAKIGLEGDTDSDFFFLLFSLSLKGEVSHKSLCF